MIDGIMFRDESCRIDPTEKIAIITNYESAFECFRYHGGNSSIKFYCLDLDKVRIGLVINLDQAKDFFECKGIWEGQ